MRLYTIDIILDRKAMKYIGFIKRFDAHHPASKDLTKMRVENKIDEKLRTSLIKYLSDGNFLFGWMSFLREEDGTPIGNNDYFTDGHYVWPRYYIYYLNKYDDLEISEDFIYHAKSRNFVMTELSKEQLNKLEKIYDEERFIR